MRAAAAGAEARAAREPLVARLVGRPAFWIALVGGLFAWPIAWTVATPLPPPLPVIRAVPPFALVDQDGRPFGSAELAGHVWLASVVFTRCATVCPATTRVVARIQARTRNLEPVFHVVTFTADPAFDTPERLAAYARAARASPRMWTFVTGPIAEVRAAVVGGLRVSVDGAAGAGPGALSHGTTLLLVDGLGRIRASYDPVDADVVDRVVRDAGLLVNSEGGGRT
jgi:protein SCO1/2